MIEQAFDFTPDDLAHNQRGELSPAQWATLHQTRLLLLGILSLPIFPFIVCILYVPLFVLEDTLLPYVMVAIIIFLAVLWFAFRGMYISWHRLGIDLQQAQVKILEGEISLSPPHILTIQGQNFELRPSQTTALDDGTSYRVYYLPHYQHILSLEIIAASD